MTGFEVRYVSSAEVVVAMAGACFAACRVTLAHDPDPVRKREAIRNASAAIDGLLAVMREVVRSCSA